MRLVILFALIALASCANREEPEEHPLIGTWRFVRYIVWDSGGVTSTPFGDPPSGYTIFDANGMAFVQLMRREPPGSGMFGPPLFGAYYGPYTINASSDTVTVAVEGASIAQYLNTQQVRPFRISNDTLRLGITGDYEATLVRVRSAVR